MKMKKLISYFIFFILMIGMCFGILFLPIVVWDWKERKQEIFLTDKDVNLIEKDYSPDSTRVLITYSLDEGAFGSSPKQMSLVLMLGRSKANKTGQAAALDVTHL